MPHINITINSNNSSANASGPITDPALIEAALTVLDAIRTAASTDEAANAAPVDATTIPAKAA